MPAKKKVADERIYNASFEKERSGPRPAFPLVVHLFPTFQSLRPKMATAVRVLFLVVIPRLSVLAGPTPESVDNSSATPSLTPLNNGAKIEWIESGRPKSAIGGAIEKDERVTSLNMGDDTLSFPLPGGETTFIITLAKSSSLTRFKFLNENAEARGKLKIAVSNYRLPAESRKWMEVDGPIPFTEKPVFDLSLLGVEARYVKLSFNVEKGGRIASLGLYGVASLQEFAQRQDGRKRRADIPGSSETSSTSLADRLAFNYAILTANAHVVYVSSGSSRAAESMIEADRETSFGFAPSDRHPTAVVELGETERLNRVSARYRTGAARLDVYLLDKFDADHLERSLDALKPVASGANANARGRATVDFDPQDARFVVFRWTAIRTDPAFEVAELDAFGDMPIAMLDLSEAPDVYASNSSSAMTRPGESHIDLSSSLGTLAVPPALPVVSP